MSFALSLRNQKEKILSATGAWRAMFLPKPVKHLIDKVSFWAEQEVSGGFKELKDFGFKEEGPSLKGYGVGEDADPIVYKDCFRETIFFLEKNYGNQGIVQNLKPVAMSALKTLLLYADMRGYKGDAHTYFEMPYQIPYTTIPEINHDLKDILKQYALASYYRAKEDGGYPRANTYLFNLVRSNSFTSIMMAKSSSELEAPAFQEAFKELYSQMTQQEKEDFCQRIEDWKVNDGTCFESTIGKMGKYQSLAYIRQQNQGPIKTCFYELIAEAEGFSSGSEEKAMLEISAA